jgi:hypothetical protein
MGVEEGVITAENFYMILEIYNSKKVQFSREEFCELLYIAQTNTITYKKIIKILSDEDILTYKDRVYHNSRLHIVDRKKLEKFILKNLFYKKVDMFMHNCMWGAITP